MPRKVKPSQGAARVHITITPEQRALLVKLESVSPHVPRMNWLRLGLDKGLEAVLAEVMSVPREPVDPVRLIGDDDNIPEFDRVLGDVEFTAQLASPPISRVDVAMDVPEGTFDFTAEQRAALDRGETITLTDDPHDADPDDQVQGDDEPSGGSAGHGVQGDPGTGIVSPPEETAAEPADLTPEGDDLPVGSEGSGDAATREDAGPLASDGRDLGLVSSPQLSEPADPVKRDTDRAPALGPEDAWMAELFDQV